jgi:hypothetical protein
MSTETEEDRSEARQGEWQIMWRADDEKWKPVKVKAPREYSDPFNEVYDADGEKVYENTHFETREEALQRLEQRAVDYLSQMEKMLKKAWKGVQHYREKRSDAEQAVKRVEEARARTS